MVVRPIEVYEDSDLNFGRRTSAMSSHGNNDHTRMLPQDEDLVVYASQKAFESLPNVSKSISELTALKGVGQFVEKATRIDVEADAVTGIRIVKKRRTEITIITQTEHGHERCDCHRYSYQLDVFYGDAKGNTNSHMAARKDRVQVN
uniref:DNA binding protein n=1 Tax=Tanacetum cinerariifolium TaxID=118510 RepID=A0A6L2LQB8_TANCI|nr:DNA binding protein [Tanacetum cinerariifolium]